MAVTFPVVLLALAVVLLAGSLARTQLACVDGARAAARAVSSGAGSAEAVAQAQAVLGRSATVDIGLARAGEGPGGPGGTGGGLVTVSVALEVVPGAVPAWVEPSGWRLPVLCRSSAWQEPTG